MLKLKNIHKTYNYKKSNAFNALKGISLEINDGELVSIIGKSGSGKSTLLHVMGIIDTFESGEYTLDGIDIHSLSDAKSAELRNSKIGIVMQDFALIESYTVLENVLLPTYFANSKAKKSGKNSKKKALELLKSVEMDSMSGKEVKKLSGGQKQRVAIARAIVNEPSIILADEPTGALDSKTASEIMGVFKQLNQSGKTVIIITHDKGIAEQCSRQIEIADGEIV
jgi:putative ABC transport system ATP-binding protein